MSIYLHKRHNVTVLLYHLVFPAKYFNTRRGQPGRKWVKLSLVVWCSTLLPLALHVAWGPSNDKVQAGELLAKARQVVPVPERFRAKVNALRALCSFSAQLGQFEAFGRQHRDRTPIIKGPLDPEPGLDKVWRLVWQS